MTKEEARERIDAMYWRQLDHLLNLHPNNINTRVGLQAKIEVMEMLIIEILGEFERLEKV